MFVRMFKRDRVPPLEMNMLRDEEIRMEAVRCAASVTTGQESIGNLLIHAQWLFNYVKSGCPPEVEGVEESTIARGVVSAN